MRMSCFKARTLLSLVVLTALAGCAGSPTLPQAPQKSTPAVTPEPAESAPERAAETLPTIVEEAETPSRPLDEDVLFDIMVAEIAGQRQHYAESLQYYLRAAEQSGDPGVAERAVRVALFARDYDSALKALDIWREASPGQPAAVQTAVTLHLRRNELAAAAEDLAEVIRTASSPLSGFGHALALLRKEEDAGNALVVARDLRDRFPTEPGAHYLLSLLAVPAGAQEEAVSAIDEAIRLSPDWALGRLTKARILADIGRLDQALALGKELVEARPTDYETRITYARMLIKSKRNQEALEEFRVLLEQNPDDAEIVYALALLALQLDDRKPAEEYLSRLVELGKHADEAAYYLGQIAEDKDDFSAARDWYARVTDGEYEIAAKVRWILMIGRLGDLDRARKELENLRGSQPELASRLYLIEGELVAESGDSLGAMAVYDHALGMQPGNIDLLYARALLGEKIDRIDILERDLQAILVQEPDNADALNALGYTLADRNLRLSEALGLIQRAMAVKPDSAAVMDSMGWVLYRMGNFQESERYLRRAHEALPDAEIAAHLGELLLMTGRAEEARGIIDAALKKDPDDALLLRVRSRLP
ncbi:MAG: tetratricopeptide repeat protein [Chromatiales bacterium]|nr:tetratricopeptide repeat protein [Chromatiales bacterium]